MGCFSCSPFQEMVRVVITPEAQGLVRVLQVEMEIKAIQTVALLMYIKEQDVEMVIFLWRIALVLKSLNHPLAAMIKVLS